MKTIPKHRDQFFVPLLPNTKDKWQVIAMVNGELFLFKSGGTYKHFKPVKNQTTITPYENDPINR